MRHLADGWGTVTSDGIVVPFELTHELLGRLIGARRPTVTVAVRALEDDRKLLRTDDGSWLLTPAGQQRVATVSMVREKSPALGEAFALRQRASCARLEAAALRAEARQMRSSSAEDRPHWISANERRS